jgi:hypothetical protein
MSIDPWFLFLAASAFVLLAAGLQMTESKLMGLALIVFSLGWLWWLFLPLIANKYFIPGESYATWLGGGWIVALLIGVIYGWQIYGPTPAPISSPQISSTNQSGGVTANYGSVVFNQASIAKVPITEPITTFAKEGNVIVLTLRHSPIPDTVRLKITSMSYNIYDSPGMTVRGHKIYLRNVAAPRNVAFFDLLPVEIPDGSVTVEYHPYSVEEGTRPHRREQEETLVSYAREGEQLRNNYITSDDISAVPAKKWAKKVAAYLEENIGPIAAHRFLSDEGIVVISLLRTDVSRQNKKVHQFITNRLLRLDEIMKKLES